MARPASAASRLLLGIALLATAAACTSPAPVEERSPGIVEVPGDANPQLEFELASGSYRCEFGLRVAVDRKAAGEGMIRIGWKGATHDLARDPSYSGLPRYEDTASGLVWIDLPWKSLLLDGRSGRPLASECKPG
jgi:hypothetical protein